MNNEASQKLQKAGGAEREARRWLTNKDCRYQSETFCPHDVTSLAALLEICANEARLEEARWWRAQIDSRLHGVFYKTNDPTAARRIEDERIAELESKK